MRILAVSKFGYFRGGLERVMFDEIQWLREAGHEVEYFATADERNEPSPFIHAFPQPHEYGPSGRPSLDSVRAMFWNKAAAAALSSVLSDFGPDVIHCHGIYRHLSPSVLREAQRARVPVVMTAHDYFLVCPGNVMLRGGSTPCEPRACGSRSYGGAIVHRCIQGSLARSALGAAELTYQRLLRHYEATVHTVICPSRFMAEALVKGGVNGPEIVVLPNAVPEMNTRARVSGGPFVFAGRLSAEKGVSDALEAARLAAVPIVIAGEGPSSTALAARFPEAKFVGRLGSEDLARLVGVATALVVPSRWYENASMSILEAMALGVPVIASSIGGIPEQVVDGREGLLVPPGDVGALASAMGRLWAEPVFAAVLGEQAHQRVRERFALAPHVAGLVGIYRKAIGSRP